METIEQRLKKIQEDLIRANADIASAEQRAIRILRNLEQLAKDMASPVPDNVFELNPPKDYPPPT